MLDVSDLIGVSFADRGRSKETGFDCWGLACEIYRRSGKTLPDYQTPCFENSRVSTQVKEALPLWERYQGNVPPFFSIVLLRFNCPFPNHVGVFLGEGKFIHSREKIGVNIDRVESPAWRDRIEGFYVPRADR
jgi:cell wall-associated NlpC family hydrolase